MKRRGLLSATGIVLLSLIVLMTLHEWDDVMVDGDHDRNTGLPLITLQGVTAQAFDEAGQSSYQLDAGELSWYENQQTTSVIAPRLTLPLADGQWSIAADLAQMDHPSETLRLEGHVVASRKGESRTTLETEQLVYDNLKQQVSSPVAVAVTHPGGSTRAGRFVADLNDGRLQFSEGVETRYVPTGN